MKFWNWLRRRVGAWRQVGAEPGLSGPRDLGRLLEHSPDGVVQLDAHGRLTYLNAAACRWLDGPCKGPAVNMSIEWRTRMPRATRRLLVRVILPALRTRGVWSGEAHFYGWQPVQSRCCSLMVVAHPGPSGQPERYSAVLRDLTADVQSRQQIQRQNDVLRAITEALPATVVIVDAEGRYRFVNGAFERYVGLDANQILGRTAVEVLGAEEVARRRPFMQKAMAGDVVDFTLDYPSEQGTRYLSLRCIPLKLSGQMDGFVGISQDITHQRREQERLTHLAERDPLTGLLNRAGFERGVEHRRLAEQVRSWALLYIDLDHFKPVNDQLGHQAGDVLLQAFADRLIRSVRGSDLVARLGGDEFVVLLAGVSDAQVAHALAGKVLDAAQAPFDIDGQRLVVSASIGVALADDPGETLRELTHRADRMLYAAKAAGRGRYVVSESAVSTPSSAPLEYAI